MTDPQPPLDIESINNTLTQFTFKRPLRSNSQRSQDTTSQTKPQQNTNKKPSNTTTTKKRKKDDLPPEKPDAPISHELKKKKTKDLKTEEDLTDEPKIHIELPKRTTRSSNRISTEPPSKSNESSNSVVSLSNSKYKVMEVTEDTDWNEFDEKVTMYTTSPKKKVQTKKATATAPQKKAPKSAESAFSDAGGFNLEETKVPYETLKLPDWAKDSNIRDKNGREPTDEDYDPTTLYIPPKALSKCTVLIKNYWEIKSQHFDKIVITRQNRCYYAYHKDAFIIQEVCGARVYSQFTFALCGMFQSNITDYCKKLTEKNYKIVLVEPRNDSGEDEDIDIYQIITKGTYVEPNPNYFITRYCLVLTLKDLFCGFTYMDTTTHQFYMGEFEDTPNRTQLRSLLLRVNPVEIVYREKTLNKEILAMLKNLYWKPTLTISTTQQPTDLGVVIAKLKGAIKKEKKLVNKRRQNEIRMDSQTGVLESLISVTEDFIADSNSTRKRKKIEEESNQEEYPQYWTLQGIYLALEFMEYLHLDEIVFNKGTFSIDNVTEKHTHNLILDGQSVYNLEVLDVSYVNNRMGAKSLFGYMNHTKSPFGERMFRRWLLEPLTDIKKINERLDAVEELISFKDLRDLIQQRLHKVPDIERLIHAIYNFGSNRKVVHHTDYDIYVEPKIMMFVEAIKQLREVDNTMKAIQEYAGSVRSKRLFELLNYEGKGTTSKKGLFPPVNDILAEFEAMMVIYEELPVPAPGKDKEFDKLMTEMEQIKKSFRAIIEEVRRKLKAQPQEIMYVHVRQRYEIQVPDHLVGGNKKPKELIQTSSKKGFVRFHTVEIQKLVNRLEEIEKEMKTVILPYIINCFKIFYSQNSTWQKVIFCMSELDCLVSLAHLTTIMPLAARPGFVECPSEDSTQVFDLKGMIHPCVALNTSSEFIKNDIVLEQDKRVFLITGPNMGGKSTLMRTVCIATIMAQVGSYVPADSFTLTPRDRIFTRIGASDNIFEGKSTFFVELEETLNIVNEATHQSLVIIDELGRGTSTYDGMAIAYAVLKNLTDNVKCMTMFATHFHMLLEEFRLFKSVEMYYMESEFLGDDVVQFLYKFKKGCISNSFGLSVARMAGLPEIVIEKGREKAISMTKEQKNLKKNRDLLEKFTTSIDLLSAPEISENDVDHVIEKLSHMKETTEDIFFDSQ